MTHIDHAEAHERIADLALEPARLAALRSSADRDDVALRDHINGCERCQAQLSEWQNLHASVASVVAAGGADAAIAIAPPAELRTRVLAAAHATTTAETAPPAAPTRDRRFAVAGVGFAGLVSGRRATSGLLALAAVLALICAGLGVWVVDDQARINSASEQTRALTGLAAAVSQVIAAPDSHMVALRNASGVAGGSIAWSQHDLVVFASTLSTPAPGQVYRCWLMYEGKQTPMGEMRFAGHTAYWVGWTEDWATVDLGADANFVVTLEPDQSVSPAPRGPVVLQSALAG